MLKKIANFLRRLADRIDAIDPVLVARVKELVETAESFAVRGERRRSWVLNNLTNEFPASKARDLAFQIEKVIQEK